MHTRLIRLVALFTLACAAGLCPAQDTKPDKSAPTKRLIVGFSQVGAESAWRTAETKSIKDEAAKRNIDLKFSDAQGKQANQLRAIKSFVAQRVDAIILAPVVETGWDEALMEAKKAKIPIILVDRGVTVDDSTTYATLIASDFIEEGRMAAKWLVEKTGGKAVVVELQGTTGAAPALDRQQGFMEVLSKNRGIRLVKTQSADFTRAKGKEVMEAFLKAKGDEITAVYAHNDDMALGAIQAIEEAGKKPGKDILVVSIDGVRAAFEAMVEGKLNATVECNPLLGPMAFDTIEKIKRGETVPKFIKQQDKLFDQSTAKDELPKRRY